MKIHLISSNDPPSEGQDLTALCGAEISKAKLAFVFDTTFQEAASLNRVVICSKCYGVRAEGQYLAGTVNGQEAMTEPA